MAYSSQAMRLLEMRRESLAVQAAMEAHREDFIVKEQDIRRREDELRRKDIELQENLIKFNKFLMENDGKRQRAERRASDEAYARKDKEESLEQLTALHTALVAKKEAMTVQLGKYEKYKTYLNSVVSASGEYDDISALKTRYDTLSDSKSEQVHMASQIQTESERADATIRAFRDSLRGSIETKHTTRASLRERVESAVLEANERELAEEGRRTSIKEKRRTTAAIRMTVADLDSRRSAYLMRFAPHAAAAQATDTPLVTGRSGLEQTLIALKSLGEWMTDLLSMTATANELAAETPHRDMTILASPSVRLVVAEGKKVAVADKKAKTPHLTGTATATTGASIPVPGGWSERGKSERDGLGAGGSGCGGSGVS